MQDAPTITQHVVAPQGEHRATLIVLHGFTCYDEHCPVRGWVRALAARLGPESFGTLKFVFLIAPMRLISCYGEPRETMCAWHDYFTDHGGDEGRPEIEEDIDVEQLIWCRNRIHEVIEQEASLLGGDIAKVAIGGQSQGSCVALDAALTLPPGRTLGGVFASCGHLYSSTPVMPVETVTLPIVAYHGAGDRCIAAGLALRSYARILDAGYHQFRMHLEPRLGHCEPSKSEGDVLAAALRRCDAPAHKS